jgi:hypothetical protein
MAEELLRVFLGGWDHSFWQPSIASRLPSPSELDHYYRHKEHQALKLTIYTEHCHKLSFFVISTIGRNLLLGRLMSRSKYLTKAQIVTVQSIT